MSKITLGTRPPLTEIEALSEELDDAKIEIEYLNFYVYKLLKEAYDMMPRQRKFEDYKDQRLADIFDEFIDYKAGVKR